MGQRSLAGLFAGDRNIPKAQTARRIVGLPVQDRRGNHANGTKVWRKQKLLLYNAERRVRRAGGAQPNGRRLTCNAVTL